MSPGWAYNLKSEAHKRFSPDRSEGSQQNNRTSSCSLAGKSEESSGKTEGECVYLQSQGCAGGINSGVAMLNRHGNVRILRQHCRIYDVPASILSLSKPCTSPKFLEHAPLEPHIQTKISAAFTSAHSIQILNIQRFIQTCLDSTSSWWRECWHWNRRREMQKCNTIKQTEIWCSDLAAMLTKRRTLQHFQHWHALEPDLCRWHLLGCSFFWTVDSSLNTCPESSVPIECFSFSIQCQIMNFRCVNFIILAHNEWWRPKIEHNLWTDLCKSFALFGKNGCLWSW